MRDSLCQYVEMFSSPASVVGEPSGYDFQKEENAAKWKGVFVNSLSKVFSSFELSSPTISMDPIFKYAPILSISYCRFVTLSLSHVTHVSILCSFRIYTIFISPSSTVVIFG